MFLRYFQSNKKYSVTNSTSNTVEFANEIETYINRLILILSISVIVFIGTFFYLGKSFIAFTLIGVELLFSIILILNKSQYTLISKVLLTSSINILTLLYASCFREGAGVHLLFFSYIGIPLILFNRDKESIYYRCGVSLPIISFSTLYLLDFKILPYANLTAFGTSLIFYMSALTTFVIIGASLRVFISQKKKYHNELFKINKELHRANQEIEETTKIKTEYNIARDIQSKFLPKSLPQVKNFKFDYAYFPSRQVSGDFFDVHVYGKDIIGFIIFDVVGKGLAASFITIKLHTLFHSVIKDNLSAKGMLAFLNKEMGSLDIKMKNSVCFYMQLNIKTNVITYADTGIGVCYHIRDHKLAELRDAGGFPLGALIDSEYTETTLQLQPGDSVLVGTDGIIDTESPKGEKLGEKRLAQCLKQLEFKSDRTATTQLTEVLKSYAQKLNLNGLEDDITWFTIEYQA